MEKELNTQGAERSSEQGKLRGHDMLVEAGGGGKALGSKDRQGSSKSHAKPLKRLKYQCAMIQ